MRNFDYYRTTRAGNLINPGVTLYRFWLSYLREMLPVRGGRMVGRTSFGDNRMLGPSSDHRDKDVGPDDRPNLTFDGGFEINHKGEFRFTYSMRGWKSRSVLAEHTFLNWAHFRNEFHWFVTCPQAIEEVRHAPYHGEIVGTTPRTAGYAYGYWLNDPDQPVHYVSERTLGIKHVWWDQPGSKPWLKLVHDPVLGWCIRYAREYNGTGRNPQVVTRFEEFEAFRQRRLVRTAKQIADVEARHELRMAGFSDDSRSIVTLEHMQEAYDKGVRVIIANFDAQSPTRTTSLRKRVEPQEEGLWLPSGSS